MKDSRLGTFGGTALFFNLAFKGAALAALAVCGSWAVSYTHLLHFCLVTPGAYRT